MDRDVADGLRKPRRGPLDGGLRDDSYRRFARRVLLEPGSVLRELLLGLDVPARLRLKDEVRVLRLHLNVRAPGAGDRFLELDAEQLSGLDVEELA